MKDAGKIYKTDDELLQDFYATQNMRLLGLLLQRYTLLLLGVCMKYLKNEEAAKDAVQQIFLKVITEVRRYKITYFKTWLYMVAKNYCLMQLRSRHNNVPVENVENLLQENELSKSNELEKEAALLLVEASLQQLNNDQKTCISLFFIDKKSYRQITQQTGYTLLQVKSFIQNGKRNLKILIEKKLNH